jgi:hypothetical protein
MRDPVDPRRWLTFAGAAVSMVGVAVVAPGLVSGQSPPKPGVATGEATGLTPSSARLRGSVDPNGSPANYRFQYGRTTSYGLHSDSQTLPAGDAPVGVKVRVQGLDPGAQYHYRVVAANESGTAVGPDRTFLTPEPQLVGRFPVRVRVSSGGKAFGQRRGDGGRRQYRFRITCPGAGQGECGKVRLRRAGKQGKFGSVLKRTGAEGWSGLERFRGHCDNGLKFRSRTRIGVRATGFRGKRVDRITGRLRSNVRGCVSGGERATFKGSLP